MELYFLISGLYTLTNTSKNILGFISLKQHL